MSQRTTGRDNLAAPGESLLVGGKDPTGKLQDVAVDASGNLLVTPATGASFTTAANTVTTGTASSYTVTTTSGTALASTATRKDAVIVNTGAAWAYLSRGATAIAGTGIALAPNGGSYNINSTNLYTGIITAITASGTTTLSISQGTTP